jgi:hypothetical protein
MANAANGPDGFKQLADAVDARVGSDWTDATKLRTPASGTNFVNNTTGYAVYGPGAAAFNIATAGLCLVRCQVDVTLNQNGEFLCRVAGHPASADACFDPIPATTARYMLAPTAVIFAPAGVLTLNLEVMVFTVGAPGPAYINQVTWMVQAAGGATAL